MDTKKQKELIAEKEALAETAQKSSKVVMHLEDQYPAHDRRLEGWKLVGFVDGAKPKNYSSNRGEYKNPHYPYGAVPIWRFLGWDKGKKYTGADLRRIRKEKGVGRPVKK